MTQKSYLWKCFFCNFVLFQSLYVRLSRIAAFNFLLNFSYFDIKPSCGHVKLLRSLDLCVWKKIQIDAIHGFFCFQEVCKLGYAYHSGKMVNGNAPANNAEECLNQCNISPVCKFWDFGNHYCRLRINDGIGQQISRSYTSGPKYCKFGTVFITSFTLVFIFVLYLL